jgi:arsenate reductase-like glutaredoxin family protein
MEVQVIGTMKCKDTQKALRYFKDRSIKVHFLDLNEKKLSKGELRNISNSVPIEELLDSESKQYKKRNMEHMVFDPVEELLDDPLLLKTPVVRFKGKATAGHEPNQWKKMLND